MRIPMDAKLKTSNEKSISGFHYLTGVPGRDQLAVLAIQQEVSGLLGFSDRFQRPTPYGLGCAFGLTSTADAGVVKCDHNNAYSGMQSCQRDAALTVL